MSSIKVNDAQLVQFKQTLDQTALQFEEIRESIQSTIDSISGQWNDDQYIQFRERFVSKSGPDITKLVTIMRFFSNYIQGKLNIIEQYKAVRF